MLDITEQIGFSAPYTAMMLPCVYIVRDGANVLYVGSSSKGIGRAFAPSHHVLRKLDGSGAVVDVIQRTTVEEAERLEEFLIVALKPSLNKARPTVDSIVKKITKLVVTDELMQNVERIRRVRTAEELAGVQKTLENQRKINESAI